MQREQARGTLGERARAEPLVDERVDHRLVASRVREPPSAEERRGRGRRAAEQSVLARELEERPARRDVREEPLDARLEPRAVIGGIARRGGERLEEAHGALVEERAEDVLLLLEVVVDRADREAGARGDVLHARRGEAALGEHLLCGIQDGRAPERARLVADSGRSPSG